MTRRSHRLLLAIAVLAALLAGVVAWLAFSESAARLGLERVAAASGGRLAVDGVEGRLVDGLRVQRIDWVDGAVRVGVEQAELRWDWRGLLDGRIAVGLLRAAAIDIELPEPGGRDAGPTAMPGAIGLPVVVLVGRVEADLVRLRRGDAGEALVFRGLRARAAHLRGEYRIEDLRVDTPWGELTAGSLRIGTEAPHPLVADASLVSSAARLGITGVKPDAPPIAIAASASGDLTGLRIEAKAGAGEARVLVGLGLDPLAPALAAGPSRLEFSGIDPSTWLVDAPAASLAGRAWIDEVVPLRGRIEIDNAAAGPLPQGGVPVASLRGGFALDGGVLRLADLEIGLVDDGRLEGELAIDFDHAVRIAGRELPATTARFTLAGIDPVQWAAAARSMRIDGEAVLERHELTATLREREGGASSLTGREPLALELQATFDEHEVRIGQARVGHGASGLDASGTIRLDPLAVDLAGRASAIDPSQWLEPDDPALARFTSGRIEGTWRARGAPGQGDLTLAFELGASRLAGASLAGRLDAVLDAQWRATRLDADIGLGGNRLTAQGAFGRPGDRLRWTIDAGEPALFDPRIGGRITGSGDFGLVGGRPWVRGRAEGRELAFEQLRARRASVRLDWPAEANAAFEARVTLGGLVLGDAGIDVASLDVAGSPAAHRFALALRAAGQRLALAGQGAWDAAAPRWDGVLESGRLEGTEALELGAGAKLGVSPAGIALADWRLAAPGGRGGSARIERVDWTFGETPQLTSSGEVAGLPLARMLAWLDRVRGRPAGGRDIDAALADLRIDGQWRIDGGATLDSLAGEARISLLEQGGAGGEGRLGIGAGSGAILRIDAGRLDGRIDLDLPSLVFLRRYLGEDWTVDGRLRIAADVGGTVDAPQLDGSLTGDGLAVGQRSQGWRLDQGELRAAFDGNSLVIERFRIASGEGDVTLAGRATLLPDSERDPGEPGRSPGVPLRGEFDLEARRFRVPLEPGQLLVLSGHSRLVSDGRSMAITGRVVADEGLIELRSAGVPALPDDVRIVGTSTPGATDAARPAVDTGGMRIGADIEVDLGRNIRIVGGGIDTRLEGVVRLRGELPAAPRVEGTVRVRDGTFVAYSQQLDITTGSIRFNGPVDNPALDITAVRPRLPIEVGVRLTGTALSPRITLFSNPQVSDAEKLSWLVLGVPLADASSGAQVLALQQAAATLFGSDGSTMSSINRQLGVDVLGLGFAPSTGQSEVIGNRLGGTGLPGSADSREIGALREVVTVGKRLASGLFISYEQGLLGAWNLLRIQYDISRRLTLQLQTGSESAIDLLLQHWFD